MAHAGNTPRPDPAATQGSAPTAAPNPGDEANPARDALRATPNQHSFDDLDDDLAVDTDAARTYHGADDPA